MDEDILFLPFLSFFLFAIVRVLMLRITIPLPQHFIVCLLGVLFAYLSNFGIGANLTSTIHLDPRVASDIILPITMFMAGYFVSSEVYQKPGLHIVLFISVTFGISLSLVAYLVSIMCHWSWLESVMFVCVVQPPGPILARTFLKRLTVSQKLETFMVGEALLSNVVSLFLFTKISTFVVRGQLRFEDFFHEVLFGPFLGYFAAKVVSYWLSRIIKDTVNTVCIVIASVYFTYILADLTHTSPVLAIVVMGICMSGRQSNIEEKTEEILLRILNVIGNFFNCNLFILVGIEIYRYMEHYSTAKDIINVMLIFFMMGGIRGFVVVLLSQILQNKGFCLSTNNLLVLCLCNIRGSLSILMCRFIILKGFPVAQPQKMFAYSLAQIALSLFINTIVSNTVIRYDILAKYDESRERFISQIMDILDNIRYRTLSANRHGNLSFADADWYTVAKFTELKHPLITLTGTTQQHLTTISPEQEESRSIRRILTIAKCSYRKQYHDGLMSRNALKLLTQWTSHALAKGQNLIFPSKVASVLTIPSFYVYLLKNFGQTYKYLTFRDNSCDFRRTCCVLFHFVDFVCTVLALANVVVADVPARNFFFLVYNLIFVGSHLLWILIQSLVKKKMDLWDVMIVPVVVVGVLDITVLEVMTSGSKTARLLRATCILTRLVRPIRIAGLFLITLKPLMFSCDRMVSQRLMDGYDIGRSYIQARLEVVRLISHVEDIPLHLHGKYKSALKQHKIEAVKMLAIMQTHCPSTLTTAKTRQATRIVLKRQEYIVNHIQQSRALGEDGAILEKMILARMSSINTSHMKISHPDYTDIIINVPWIKDLSEVFLQVMDKGVQYNYKKYDTIVSQYEDLGGIFIILNGIAWVQRESQPKHCLSVSTALVTVDYLSSGSVIGEYAFLTGKPRHKTIGCCTDLMGIFIKSQFLYEVMGGRPNVRRHSLLKLEEKMWRVVALRIALRFLMGEPSWLAWSQSQILMRLVDSVLVDGSDTDKTFNEWVGEYDIVLIQGKIMDVSSHEHRTAPAYIPKQRSNYAFMAKNEIRPLMLAIPSVEECELHVSTYDKPSSMMLACQSESQCTFSSGSSNNPPNWQLRRACIHHHLTAGRSASQSRTQSRENSSSAVRFETNNVGLGRKALKSIAYPLVLLIGKSRKTSTNTGNTGT